MQDINPLADKSDERLVANTNGNDPDQANGVEMSRRLKLSVETLNANIMIFNAMSSRQGKLMVLLSVLMTVLAFLQLFSFFGGR